MKFLQRCSTQVPGCLDAQMVAAGTLTVEEPITHDEGTAREARGRGGCSWSVDHVAPRHCQEGSQLGVSGEGSAHGSGDVCVQEAGSIRVLHGTSVNRGCCGGGGSGHEELERRVRLVVASMQRRPRAVREPLARQEVGRVDPTLHVDDVVLEFGEQVEPTRLVVADVALLLQPLQTRVISVQLEGLVEEMQTQRLECHCQKLQQVGWVRTLGEDQVVGLKGDGMEHASVVGDVGLLQDGRNGQLGGVSEQVR
jgi:hypothetical protein